MGLRRKRALERIAGLVPRIDEHIAKLAENPTSRESQHWLHEIHGWIEQIDRLTRFVGSKTAAEWQDKIDSWRLRIGE